MKPRDEQSPEHVPEGLEREASLGGVVYRWRTLPDSPGTAVLFGALGLFVLGLGLLGIFLLAAAILDWLNLAESQSRGYGSADLVILGIVLVFVSVKAGGFFAGILFGRCRLRFDPSDLDYEFSLFGRTIRSKSFRIPAAGVLGFAIKDAARRGMEVQRRDGSTLTLMLQRFSEKELMQIKKRFLMDLGRDPSAEPPKAG